MSQFSIVQTIKNELEEFDTKQLRLAQVTNQESGRTLRKKETAGYFFNQKQTINLIDLYYNSRFESGPTDAMGQEKVFLNIGKFRCDVSSKQIDLDAKNFRFVQDPYADPFVALFLQKDFNEWAKDSYFGELVNECVDAFPKYGTVVIKKVPNPLGAMSKFGLHVLPLQLLVNEQEAESLKTASYVIEPHLDMKWWEIEKMTAWDTSNLEADYDSCYNVYERYGYVPLAWLKQQNKEETLPNDEGKWVNAITVVSFDAEKKKGEEGLHVFFAKELDGEDRPYEEAHWSRQHGRWLGCGVMEDLLQNQKAKNLIINLIRRSLHWSSKRMFKTKDDIETAKNLMRDVQDGDLINVGATGDIAQVDMVSRTTAEYQQFLNEWDRNSDQKAFTYEVATGESLSAGTPFRLGVLLQGAVNSYFGLKQEKLGLFLKRVMEEFMIPQFIKDMGNKERLVQFFSDTPGFEVLKEAAVNYAQSEAVKTSLLSGQVVDAQTVSEAVGPFDSIKVLTFSLPESYYQEAKYKFDLVVTGENRDTDKEIQTLSTLFQILPPGDPRKEGALTRLGALGGVNVTALSNGQLPKPQQVQQGQQPNVPIATTTQQ